MSKLTAEQARALLEYMPETGVFYWRVARARTKAGAIAGTIHAGGYRDIQINKKKYRAHRLAWLIVHGKWPDGDLDHINRDHDNNKLDNLRPAPDSGNNANRRGWSKVGLKGVCLVKKTQKWRAQISVNKKKMYLGDFETPEEAHAAYCVASKEHFASFACNEHSEDNQ